MFAVNIRIQNPIEPKIFYCCDSIAEFEQAIAHYQQQLTLQWRAGWVGAGFADPLSLKPAPTITRSPAVRRDRP